MPRLRKTLEEIAEMREHILNAAMDLLETMGTAGLSIRKIGRRLGVSHMVLYTYFENRNAVVEALKERWLARLQAQHAEASREAAAGDALVVLRESLASVIQLSHKHPWIYRLVWVHVGSDELAQDRSRHTEGHLDHLARLIGLCIDRGQCVDRDPRLAAAIALCIINSPQVLYHSARLTDKTLYAQLEPKALQAATEYLTGCAFRMV